MHVCMHMHTHPHTLTYIDKHLHAHLHLSCLYTIELRGLLIRCIRNNCTFPERAPSYVPLAIDTQHTHAHIHTNTHTKHTLASSHTRTYTRPFKHTYTLYTHKNLHEQKYMHTCTLTPMHIHINAHT